MGVDIYGIAPVLVGVKPEHPENYSELSDDQKEEHWKAVHEWEEKKEGKNLVVRSLVKSPYDKNILVEEDLNNKEPYGYHYELEYSNFCVCFHNSIFISIVFIFERLPE